MCAFPIDQAERALAFGADVHPRVASIEGGGFGCRVGINSGQVAVEPHGRTGRLEAYGPPANRAARLAKAANVGQTLVDGGTVEIAKRDSASPPLYDLGEHGFKGVEEAIRVLQVGEGFFPPIRSLSYGKALVDFIHSDAGNVGRSRHLLGVMDALGLEAVPVLDGLVIERTAAESVLERGLSEREGMATKTRLSSAG
jgi:hypothetical protein